MPSGLLLIDKPIEITSFDVIRKTRKALNTKKMGHAGTLDPFASGLMIVAVGEGTKTLSELLLSEKEYIAEIYFGATSTTDDREGEKIHTENMKSFSLKDFKTILPEFMGKVEQVPPQYSALKVQGKRACDRVRAGEDMSEMMEKKKREIEMYALEVLKFEFPIVTLRVHCSSGTYIRSLARDIGERMQCGAYLENLRRTKIGDFKIENSQNLEKISEKDLVSLRPEFFPFPSVQISEEEEADLRMGRVVGLEKVIGSVETKDLLSQKISLFSGERMVGFGEVKNENGVMKIQPRKLLTRG